MFARPNQFKTSLILLFILVLKLPELIAQEPEQNKDLKWLTEEQGLPSSNVETLAQDHNGNLFLGGYFGCVIYNGKKMLRKTIKDGLPCTAISKLFCSPKGVIWAYTYSSELAYYEKGKFHPVHAVNKKISTSIGLINVVFDNNDNPCLDFRMPRESIVLRKEKNKWTYQVQSFEEYQLTFRDKSDISHTFAYFKRKDLDNGMELTLYFKNKKFKPHTFFFGKEEIMSFAVTCINNVHYVAFSNRIIVLSKEKGLIQAKKMEQLISGIYPGLNRSIWTSYWFGGLQQRDARNFAVLGEVLGVNQMIKGFSQDFEDGKWMIVHRRGLAYSAPKHLKHIRVENQLLTLVNNVESMGDTLIIAHSKGGKLGYFIPGKTEKEVLLYDPMPDPPNLIIPARDISLTHPDRIYFTISYLGAYEFDKKSKQTRQIYKGTIGNLHTGKNKTYYPSYDGKIYVEEKGKRSEIDFSRFSVYPKFINCVYEQKDGSLLIGSENGLWIYKNNKLKLKNKAYYFRERISGIFPLPNQNLAIATAGSGIIFCSEKDTLILTQNEGLIGNLVNKIILDDKKRIWVAALGGVSIIDYDFKAHKVKGIRSISGSEFLNWDIFGITQIKDKMYACSSGGISIIPNDLKSYNYPIAPVSIETIKLNNKVFKSDEISYTNFKNSRLEFYYQSVSFMPTQQNNYYYRLKNYQNYWLKTTDTKLTFGNLPPGNFVFEIYAQNPYSGKKSGIYRSSVVVNPQFWQRPLFQVFVLLVCIGVVILIYQRMVRRNRKKIELQESLLRLKQEALNAKLNPHFIFNALNSIQNFIAKNNSMESIRYLAKFAKLIRLVLDSSARELVSLADELQLIELYLDLEQLRFRDKLEFSIVVDPDIDPEKIEVPLFLLEPYVENAVWHGINHKEKGGKVEVFVKFENEILKCSIADNGIGRAQSFALKTKKEKVHQSHGLKINERRIEVINTLFNKNISVEVNDRLNTEGEVDGTIVSISMRL